MDFAQLMASAALRDGRLRAGYEDGAEGAEEANRQTAHPAGKRAAEETALMLSEPATS
jgi:hypothetical protein